MPRETTYTSLRENLASVLDEVVNRQDTVIVRRRGARDVALLPATELAGLLETAHLLRSPRNAKRLLAALPRAERGKTKPEPALELGARSSVKRERKRLAVFQPEFPGDLRFWVETERSTAIRVLDLIEVVIRDRFAEPGKPEPLRHVLAGCWSRRITQEHRLAYRVRDDAIDFLQARYHY